MSCGFCQRVRSLLFGRSKRCIACERAMQAVQKHERSTQNLTRAALDGIDWAVADAGDGESANDIRTLVDDMLRSLDSAERSQKGSRT